jgi:hypothetical protein
MKNIKRRKITKNQNQLKLFWNSNMV